MGFGGMNANATRRVVCFNLSWLLCFVLNTYFVLAKLRYANMALNKALAREKALIQKLKEVREAELASRRNTSHEQAQRLDQLINELQTQLAQANVAKESLARTIFDLLGYITTERTRTLMSNIQIWRMGKSIDRAIATLESIENSLQQS